MNSVRLRPISTVELAQWLGRTKDEYVVDRVRAGEPEDVARRVADAQFDSYFPDGRPAERHEVFVIEDAGEPVGRIWVGPHPRQPDDAAAAWLFDIEVDEQVRGRGIARAALSLVEQHLAGRGVAELGLNVFGFNDPARRLYRSAGYREVAVTMSKALDGSGEAAPS